MRRIFSHLTTLSAMLLTGVKIALCWFVAIHQCEKTKWKLQGPALWNFPHHLGFCWVFQSLAPRVRSQYGTHSRGSLLHYKWTTSFISECPDRYSAKSSTTHSSTLKCYIYMTFTKTERHSLQNYAEKSLVKWWIIHHRHVTDQESNRLYSSWIAAVNKHLPARHTIG